MQQEELESIFNRQASSYDEKWSKMAAIRDALHLLMQAALADLPEEARILCVGAGTGSEILFLAERFPRWHFTAVEPSVAMLEVFQRKAEEQGIANRCTLHTGYLETLPASGPFDAATSLLVSQFLLEQSARINFFRAIARRLVPGGILISSDLTADLQSIGGQDLQEVWFRLMRSTGIPIEGIEGMRVAYQKDVAVLPQNAVAEILSQAGFASPQLFAQFGLIHAWFAKRQ